MRHDHLRGTPHAPPSLDSTPKSPARVCGARTREGRECQQKPIRGRKRCRLHGGLTPRGQAHHAYKHGRYSRDLPENLAERFRASLSDPKLLEHRDDVALLDLRVTELVRRLRDGDSGEFRSDLKDAWLAVEDADDADEKQTALSHVGWLINEAFNDQFTWTELRECVDHRGRIASREHARMKLMSEYMPHAEVAVLIGAVCEGVKQHVQNQDERDRIAEHIRRVLASRDADSSEIDDDLDSARNT